MHPYVNYSAIYNGQDMEPKCPSTSDWIKKRWYIHTMEYYSAIKKNGILPSAIMLSEINQTEKDKYHTISMTCRI